MENSQGDSITNLPAALATAYRGSITKFLIGREFIGSEACAMILGDNIFYGGGLRDTLDAASENAENGFATIFGYHVEDPERFGVM